jgi:opacity protein-like surface antigen
LIVRPLILVCAFAALNTAALADDAAPSAPAPSLPSLAIDPQAPPPSIWHGLYVGSEVSFSAAKHAKGNFGGGAFIGYDRHLDNNLVLGLRASTGFEPFSIAHSPFRGYDYAEASAKLGYEMGRLTPYLTAGIALAKPNGLPGAGYLSPTDSANDVFNGGANLSASGVFGAGFDYALTSNTTVGLAAVVGTGRGFVAPP